MSSHLSFAEVVRGEAGNSKSSDLKGHRCWNCGSWDVLATVIGAHNVGVYGGPKQKCSKGN